MTADTELGSPQIPPAMGINQAQQSVAENIFSTIIFIFKLGLVMESMAISRASLVSASV
jgi:hypothetical protein